MCCIAPHQIFRDIPAALHDRRPEDHGRHRRPLMVPAASAPAGRWERPALLPTTPPVEAAGRYHPGTRE